MNYTKFMSFVKSHITDYLPEEYKIAEVTLMPVKKLDEEYIGLTVRKKEQISAPIVNMKLFFEKYQQEDELELVLNDIAELLQTEPPTILDPDLLSHYEKIKPLLFIRVSSAKKGEAIQNDSPYQMIGDLLITYHIYVSPGGDGWFSTRVTNEILKTLGVSKETLALDAYLNTPKLFTPKLESLLEAVTGEKEDDPNMLVVTNEDTAYGANALFIPGMMEDISTKLGGNFFAIPSSIHEFIVVVDDGRVTGMELKDMLKVANETVVRPEEILSYNLYHYDCETKELNIAA